MKISMENYLPKATWTEPGPTSWGALEQQCWARTFCPGGKWPGLPTLPQSPDVGELGGCASAQPALHSGHEPCGSSRTWKPPLALDLSGTCLCLPQQYT